MDLGVKTQSIDTAIFLTLMGLAGVDVEGILDDHMSEVHHSMNGRVEFKEGYFLSERLAHAERLVVSFSRSRSQEVGFS